LRGANAAREYHEHQKVLSDQTTRTHHESVIDQDTQEVIDRLDAAVATSGLSLRRFAHALGTSPSRLSSYRTGRVAPAAAFLVRAERIANALRQARRDSIPTLLDAMESIRRADSRSDDDWTYALALEARDRLRDTLHRHRSLAATWEIQPPSTVADRWRTLLAAFVSHEFAEAGLPAPPWTEAPKLDTEWILDTPRLSEREVKRQTPDWLAERNIFVAEKDLVTR
jgi:transcriptional regulator with XRE-family HTH domain